MPTYDVDVGGKTYEVDAPDPDTAWQWANSYANEQASAQPAPTPTGERTWGETVTDVGAGLVQGAGSLVSLPGQLYGLATGNFSPTGSLGLGQSISEAGEGMKSEGLKFREAESARAVEEAEKNGQLSAFATRFIETVTDPAQLTNFLATVVPQLILPAGAAKVVAGKVFASTLEKGMAAGLSQEAAKEAAQKAAISYGTAAAKGAGATMQGAEVGTSSYEDIYKKLIEQGASETEAADQAIGLARSAGAGAGVVSFLAQSLPGASALEAKFAGKAGAGRIATGVKEAGSEMLEEAPGQAIQNLAMQQVDPTQSLMEGVGASAAQALIGGLGAGLALGAGPNAAEQEQTKLKAEQAAFEEERRSEIKRLQEDRDRAREGLGLNEDRPLALPAPALEADVEAEDRELVNPVGNIPKEELSPEVVKYIDTYRKENNLPRLNSYSIEDVRDAMTQVNPEGEQGALDSILAAKTGYTGEERYVADDVLNAATEKNVATDTQGFNDFLERTTGRNTLDGMSQPQFYSAFKALKDMKRDDTTEQLVLPEGTNAARFTTKQYNNAVKLANMAIEESGGTLGIDSLVTEIKEATNLETDRDALSILEAAIKNEDLNESRKPVYRTYKPDSTTPVATYDTSDKADTAAKKQGLNVQKETLRQITPKAKTAPKIRPSGLPAGYEVTESTLAETDVPAAYGISVEGEGKPLSTVKTEAEAPAKVARLQALRAKRADQMSANIGKANSAIDRGQANLDRLEADGKGGTEAYQKQQAKQASRVKTLGNRIKLFEDQRAKFLAPLQVKPMGKRTPTRSSYTVKKDGQSIGSFPTQQAAEESVISQLADAELEALSAGEVSRVSNRAAVELEARKSGRTGIPVKGTKERLEKAGVETADFQEKVKALKEQLVPMLAKFGLKDVALKIVRQVAGGKADGSYSGLDNLIEIAMSADKPIRTMRHEVIHALRGLGFFTPQQWGALQRQAKQTWIPKYLAGRTAEIDGKIMTRLEAYQQMGLSEIDIIEEAIADAFADFDVSGQAPAGLMQSLFKRLQNFFKALRAAFGGAGFESAEEIFGKIEVGALVPRESKIARSGGIKRSLATPATTDEDGVSPDSPSESKASPAAKAVNDGPYSDAAIRAINSKGSDSSNKLEVDEVGELFDKAYLKEFGVKGSWQVPADFKRAVSQAVIELKHQMQQAKSGLDWYEQDIADAFKATEKYIPSLSKPEKRALFSVIAGIMSPSTNARDNWFIAVQAYQHYEKTGILPGNNPATGGLWMGGLESANKKKQLDMLNAMLQPKSRGGLGEKAAIEWLQGSHTVAEITNFRKQYGNMGKSSAGGKAIDIVPGFTAFGPKVGPFVMNINGLHEVTVDVWMTRTFNRYFGQMMGPDGKMLRAPTEPQRVAVKNLATEAAKQLGIKPYQVQSVLWFFEQNLFNKLGTGAKSYAFSDGATKFAESQDGTGTAKGAAANVGANATANGATGNKNGRPSVQTSKRRAAATGPKLSLRSGVVVEVAPNPNQEVADNWREMTQAERLNATKAVSNRVVNRIFDELGLKGFTSYFSSGKYEGELNPNIIVEAPEGTSIEILRELASVMGYVLDQKAMVSFDESNTSSGDQNTFVEVIPPTGMSEDDVNRLRNHISESVAQADGDTLRNDRLIFGNFSAYNDKVATLSGDKYREAIADAVGSFDYVGEISVSEPKTFHSELIWPKSRENYLEGTRYGDSDNSQGSGRSDVRGRGLSRLQALSSEAIGLRDRWIDGRGAARGASRVQSSKVSVGEPTAEYGKAREGIDSVVGVHFSKQRRKVLSSYFHGEGLRGLEKARLLDPANRDIKNRVYFYVDTGAGVFPEAGVGQESHVIRLNNLYDVQKDELGIVKNNKGRTELEIATNLERKILQSGYDGYLQRSPMYPQGFAVLIGEHTVDTNKKFSLKTHFSTPEAAERAAYRKSAPVTKAFKQWFGGSSVVEEGRPKVMFHASPNEFEEFSTFKPIFVSEDAKSAEFFASLKRLGKKSGRNYIYPLWVRAETPFDFENKDHVQRVVQYLESQYAGGAEVAGRIKMGNLGPMTIDELTNQVQMGKWTVVESANFQEALKTLGFDSFYVQEDSKKNLAVFKANQVKSITGNIGDFSLESKNMKLSLPVVSSAVEDRVNATTQPRENEGWVTRLMNITSPESRSNLRAGLINRYNQLSIYDRMLAEKMGGVELMADQRSESAALFSDLSAGVVASALGVGARRGGVPIYKGGFTTVDTSTKGLIEIFSPLALYGDPKVYQYYQYWSAVKRGTRLLSEGRERLIEEGDRVYAAELQKQFPEFVSVQKDFNEFNNGLMAYAVATDVISKEAAAEYTKYADYVPFFRQLNGEQTVGPRVFNAISGVKPPRKLKGGEAPLSDFLENSVRNVQAIVNAGMKNSAGIKAVDVAMQLGTDVGAEELSQQSSAPNTVTVLKKGKPVSYQVGDQLFIDAVKSLNMTEIPFIGVLSKPSEVLRNLVTRDPGFMFANLLRDSLSAYVTSGVSMTPVVGTMTSFAEALAGKNRSMEDLFNAGIIGGYEFSANVEASGERLGKDLQRKYGSKTVSEKVLRPFTWLWDGLEKGTTASDAATRTLVYDRVLAETGNEMEALSRSLEVMNFNRRGSSTLIRILTASVPFLNARIQGLDLFYRASSGAMNTNDAKQIQKAFWVRGLTMMALSAMYFMAVSGDDEYKKQEQETKDNNWIVPYLNIKLPIPFEVGTLFKTVPERIIALAFGEDTSGDFFKSMQGALLNTFAFNPVPQAIKPLLEARVNYNFFTTRPLISQGMEDVAPEYQYTPGTSEVAKWLGKQIGVSPIKIDHVVRGYTGTLGGYAVSLTDAALETVGASTKASKTFVQLPLVKRFALDPDARGKVSDFYEIKNSVDQFVRTSNLLEKTMQPEEFKKFVSKNKGLYAVKDYVRDIEKSMKEMREMRTTVQNLNISPDSKRDLLVNIGKRENNLVANIQIVKQIASR
jgi:hypothetical protein